MKKLGCLLLLLCLTGCSVPVWETVDDDLSVSASQQQEAYTVQIGVPDGMTLLEDGETFQLYSTDNGELEIETQTFLTAGVDSAVKTLTGFSAEELTILQTTRFDMPEYQFAWVAQTEQGARLYRADMVLDGTRCYAVVCSSLESAGDYYAFQARQVFSSFGLYQDEGV